MAERDAYNQCQGLASLLFSVGGGFFPDSFQILLKLVEKEEEEEEKEE